MRAGLIASLVVHVVVLVAGAVSLNFGKELNTAPVDSLPVDLVPVSELTKLQLGTKEAKEIKEAALQPTKKPAEKPEPEKKTGEAKKEVKKVQEAKKEVQQAETPPPPPEPAEPEPAPKEVPKEKAPVETAELGPEIEKTEKPKQVVKVRPRSKPKPPARPKAPKKEEPKKKEDFNSKMAALLNKTNAKSSGTAKSAKPASLGSELGQTNVKMSQSELDALRGQVARCWNPPVGAAGAEDLTVRLQFNLSRTGEVEGQMKVLNSSSNPTFRAAASSAERAVYRCGPYSLPAAKYDAWKTVILNFDPRDMLGY
ncbi:cell envelope biogenesis protein TolA [Pseudovibrio ascidiaceicola]|uniref:cell envelope biogenesis protein TolA n=1 Tax=Pseudovibrio ascidiaceicola TaxID=285279 RepID=UPI003D3604A5